MGDVSLKIRISLSKMSNRTKFNKEVFEIKFERDKLGKLMEINKYSIENILWKRSIY